VPEAQALAAMCALFKDRCHTTVELADWLAMFVAPVQPTEADVAQHVTEAVKPALAALATRLATATWDKPSLNQAIKDTIGEFGIKMPQLAIPVRVLVCGRAQTPSVDAVLALFSREEVIRRLQTA
jgi:glutamyl-tRNA synthetase